MIRSRLRPRLVIIGAQKAGTTTLFDILAQHPKVIAPRRKEISFFSNDKSYAEGMSAYWAEFPAPPLLSRGCTTLDASPMYLYHQQAPERIAQHLPDALCLAVLRDPVERAYSAWNMYHRFKEHPRHGHLYDPRAFEQAVQDEIAGKPQIPARRYLDRGRYAPQLDRYITHLGPERLLVRDFAMLRDEPARLVNDLLQRLGLRAFQADDAALSTRSNARPYVSPLSADLENELRAFFAEDAMRTSELVERHSLGSVPISP